MSDKEYKAVLKNVRLSYPNIRKPFEEGGKLSARFLLDKDTQSDQIDKLEALIQECMENELEVKKLPSDRKCMRDGDDVDRDGYENTMFVSASNDKIQILSRKREVISADDAAHHPDEPYAGCFVNVSLRLWAQNSKEYGKRINANLIAIQFAKHGDAFGRGAIDATNDFDDIDDDDGEDWAA